MKKTIIAVIAIVLLLGANRLFAMKTIPSLALSEPLNFIQEQIWNDIQLLQTQITSLVQRVANVEQKPVGKNLKVFDANNKEIGYFIDQVDKSVYEHDYKDLKIFANQFNKIITVDEFSGVNVSPLGDWPIYFSQPDCIGTTYVTSQHVASSFKTYILYYPENSTSLVIPLQFNNTTTKPSFYGKDGNYPNYIIGCHNITTSTQSFTQVQLINPIPSYKTPLQLRIE